MTVKLMPPKTKATRKAPAKGGAVQRGDKPESKETVHISAYQLCEKIKKGLIEPESLTDIQRDACIEYLKYDLGWTNLEISEFIKRHRHTIAAHCRAIEDRQAQELADKGMDKFKVATKLYMVTEMIKANARRKGDFRLVMDAEHRLVEKLQSLGVLYEEPKKHHVSGEVEHRHQMLIGQVIELMHQYPEGEQDNLVRIFAERHGKQRPAQS